ncbi:MAG: adenosylcobinamide-GDP ribazoletransferase [Actinomycetota bacterium]
MSGLVAALGFYTRLPLPSALYGPAELARSAPWFPVAGLGIGAAIAGVFVASHAFLPAALAAVIAVSVGAVVTGAFHEDGLGDVADAFPGGWTVERRLEILDDPRQGTFGVLALTAALVTRVVAIGHLEPYGALALLPAAHALSRVPAIVLMRRAPLARRESLAAAFAQGLDARHEVAAVVVGAGAAALLIGVWALPAVALCILTSVGMLALARRKIGGISGDVLGAIQQLAELGMLIMGVAAVHEGWRALAWWQP